MSAKNRDNKNRWRNITVGFRVSPEENELINRAVALSGLPKQEYCYRRCLNQDVVVQGNPRVYKALKTEFATVLAELKRIEAGKKAKVLLLRMSLSGANVLILDEPTRNFSPLSGPVIRKMLREFPGAVISISHDRKYIEEVCDKIYQLRIEFLEKEIENKRVSIRKEQFETQKMLDDTKAETQKLQSEGTDLHLKNSELRVEYSENVDKLTDKQKEIEVAQKEADKWMMITDTAKWQTEQAQMKLEEAERLKKELWELLMATII